MKKLSYLTAFLILTSFAHAETFSATQDGSSTRYSRTIEGHEAFSEGQSRVESTEPRPNGVIYEMTEHGFVEIDPTAPRRFGYGQRFLTTNPMPGNTVTEDSTGEPAKREFGGIKLIGIDF